jgi:hypothetical protein
MKTVAEFKRFMAGEAGKLADAVLVATARAQLERERVDSYVEPIFQTFGFRDMRTEESLAHSRLLYLVGEAQEELVAKFYAACDAAHRERGFTGPEGHCPALTAEHEQAKAEERLLRAAGEWLGFDAGLLYGERRKKMLDLLLGANALKYRGR